MTIPEVLDLREPDLANMPLTELLDAQKGWGTDRIRRFLLKIEITETRVLGPDAGPLGLTERQREVVQEALR